MKKIFVILMMMCGFGAHAQTTIETTYTQTENGQVFKSVVEITTHRDTLEHDLAFSNPKGFELSQEDVQALGVGQEIKQKSIFLSGFRYYLLPESVQQTITTFVGENNELDQKTEQSPPQINWILTFLWVVLVFVCVFFVALKTPQEKTTRLLIFYVSLFVAVFAGYFVGGLAGILAGGFAAEFTGRFDGVFDGVLVGGLAGILAGINQDPSMVLWYFVPLTLMVVISFLFRVIYIRIKNKKKPSLSVV